MILNEFETKIIYDFFIFKNLYQEYFETFIKMISDPKYESVKYTLILILKLIEAFKNNFKGEPVNKICDFFIEYCNDISTRLFNTSFE